VPAAAATVGAVCWATPLARAFRQHREAPLAGLKLITAATAPAAALIGLCLFTAHRPLAPAVVLGAIPYLLLLLPACTLLGGGNAYCLTSPTVMLCFLLADCLVLIGSAVGFDRQLHWLNGQALLTVCIFFLWYLHSQALAEQGKGAPARANPTRPLRVGGAFPCILMAVAIAVVVLGGAMTAQAASILAVAAGLDEQLLAAVLLGPPAAAAAWPLVRAGRDIGQAVSNACMYAILILAWLGAAVMFAGPLRFSLSLWQMEGFCAIFAAALWLALARRGEKLTFGEAGGAVGLFVLYLVMRVLAMLVF